MSAWRCRNCRSTFQEPSFSEGPKTVDQETLKVIRFAESRLLCPACFSPSINPTERVAASLAS